MARMRMNRRHGGRSRPMSPASRFFFQRLFPLPFILIGLGVLVFGINSLRLAIASSDWPSVEGVVVSSEVVSSRDSDGNTTYRPNVVYEYEVDGANFVGDRLAFGGSVGTSGGGSARSVVQRYPVGKVIDVHYRPGHPQTAVLEPGLGFAPFFLIGFGFIFFSVGLAAFLFMPRMIAMQEDRSDLSHVDQVSDKASDPKAPPPQSAQTSRRPAPPPSRLDEEEDNPFRDRD
ncbi:MAG: DUF3592 domain-containing protein [Planctomycetota bacterium]|nr:MAG: DUF3592 domain-containing protein [Planctomycetota bacterium]